MRVMYVGHTPACWLCVEWPLCFYHLNTVLSHLWSLWIKPKYMGLYLGSTYMIDFCEKLLWKRIIESGYFHTTLRRKLPKQRMAYLAAYWGFSQAMTGHHHGNVSGPAALHMCWSFLWRTFFSDFVFTFWNYFTW